MCAIRQWVVVGVLVLGCIGLAFLPGPRRIAAQVGETARAEVVETDNSDVQLHGLI